MAEPLIFVSRLVRLPLLDADGVPVGRLDDVVLTSPPGAGAAPRVLGFVALLQRRKIFVNANRVHTVDSTGAHLRTGTVDLRRFQLRPGEILARGSILDRRVGTRVVNDLALRRVAEPPGWVVASASLGSGGLLRRRAVRTVPWTDLAGLFDTGSVGSQVAALRDLHPSELASRLAGLPAERRRALAIALEDERLADLLEEMPENEQVRLIESLDLERAADVLEAMEADDAADLLAELPVDERNELLAAMAPAGARPLRRLLAYQGDTAGGLMTPDPVILTADTTVAEALARVRVRELPMAIAAQVFVVEPPTATPTGRYLGWVSFQRLLREPPGGAVGDCLEGDPVAVRPDLRELAVAGRLAAYDAIAVPVCDESGRLVGAVTVDDVLDRVLPEGWRARSER